MPTSDDRQRRFVVLLHTEKQGDHYDLMIEDDDALETWKMADPPEAADTAPLGCRRIARHRTVYLEYEGLISGDRGSVRRHDAGLCRVNFKSDASWRVEFDGGQLKGPYDLIQSAPSSDQWELRCFRA